MTANAAVGPGLQMFKIICTSYSGIPQCFSPTVHGYIFNFSTRIKLNYKNLLFHVCAVSGFVRLPTSPLG